MDKHTHGFDWTEFYRDSLPTMLFADEMTEVVTGGGLCEEARWHTANCPPFLETTLEVEDR